MNKVWKFFLRKQKVYTIFQSAKFESFVRIKSSGGNSARFVAAQPSKSEKIIFSVVDACVKQNTSYFGIKRLTYSTPNDSNLLYTLFEKKNHNEINKVRFSGKGPHWKCTKIMKPCMKKSSFWTNPNKI